MTQAQVTTADVHLWGNTLGSVTWNPAHQFALFEYAPPFRKSGLQIAPFTVPLSPRTFCFPELNEKVFRGLPGFLTDSLPDKFGNAVIDTWLAREGFHKRHLNPVEQLQLIGTKGMGALEYSPLLGNQHSGFSEQLDLNALVECANAILAGSGGNRPGDDQAFDRVLQTMLRIGISADGSRAKAIVAWHPDRREVYAGHATAPKGLSHWLLKFDGITDNRDKEAADPQGYGLVEYAYHLMAVAAGVTMMESRLLQENGRRHFITRRFDRTDQGEKIHRQSLCAMGHMDFDAVGNYSYEEVMHIIQSLELGEEALEQQFRRMVFNVLARNHDDHPKNIAFLMDRDGSWTLSPAYDITFAYNPEGKWTRQHQMSLNGKRDHFSYEDLTMVARHFGLPINRAHAIIAQVAQAVTEWPSFAEKAGVASDHLEEVASSLRLHLV